MGARSDAAIAAPSRIYTNHHGGSHGYLPDEFVRSIIDKQKPLVDIVSAQNRTMLDYIAPQSSPCDGEIMTLP